MNETPSPLTDAQTEQINDTIRYAMWSVFRLARPYGAAPRDADAAEIVDLLDKLSADGVVVRGVYELSGLRADADVMVWWHAPEIEQVQDAYQRLRRTGLGSRLEPVWSQVGLHRPAEFNRSHVPAFLSGEEPRGYICVYPFVRSYDWYVISEDDRRRMLAEHGQKARGFTDVRANTVSAFALGDYEWLLAFEADDLHRIVDLMRHLRATEARLHVREEIPFYTGPRVSPADLLQHLP